MRVVADNLYAREPAPLLNVGIVDTLVLVGAQGSSRADSTVRGSLGVPSLRDGLFGSQASTDTKV